jgi:hypothetical protein
MEIKIDSLEKSLKLCEDLQEKVHLRDVTHDISSLRYSCDLLLRNMIMVLDQTRQGKAITDELFYLMNNVIAAQSHLTKEKATDIYRKYY